MTLSATAIINGLTMLRAYHRQTSVVLRPYGLTATFSRDVFDRMHDDDKRRMNDEGWVYWNDPGNDEWRLSE